MKTNELLPSVVFCQSRKECGDIAQNMDLSICYTSGEQKGKIKAFWKKSLERLKPVDRELNQLKVLKTLVERGIGVHHAGLLPIAKEIVEILFADGFLSVVFATKTLAIGINMPARSVMFLNVIEFYGKRQPMSSSEYLQMAGRAGRRGKDTEGVAMIFLDPSYTRPPKKEEVVSIIDSTGCELASQFKMSYKMILNIMKSDGIKIDQMISNSFLENTN